VINQHVKGSEKVPAKSVTGPHMFRFDHLKNGGSVMPPVLCHLICSIFLESKSKRDETERVIFRQAQNNGTVSEMSKRTHGEVCHFPPLRRGHKEEQKP
jgi:hypothetical protein